MVDIDIIDSVLKKFQTAPRQPKYLGKPEYAHLKERNKQIFLSSAWYKAHESYDRVVSYQESMTDGKQYFVCSLPYQVSIKENLLMREEVQDEMAEKTFNEIKWEMEMNAQFWGSNLNSFFHYDELQKNRKLTKVYYPKDVTDYLNDKDLIIPKKTVGEIRVVSADIAMMKGNQNDASCFTVARLIPTKNGYERHIVYMETIEGGHTTTQTMRIRQLFYDFMCDYIVLDTFSSGMGIFDQLTEHKTDPLRGTEYPALTCMNDERLAERCVYQNAPKVIYSIRASAQLNSEIATNFKDNLRRGTIKLPVNEGETDDLLNSIKGYSELPAEIRLLFRMPYIQTTLMVNEVLNLESDINDAGMVRLKEVSGSRKDRYTSISYLSFFASELEIKNRKKKQTVNPAQLFMFKKPKLEY